MGIGKIKSVTPIQVTIEDTLSLSTINQYSLRPDALAGIKPIIEIT